MCATPDSACSIYCTLNYYLFLTINLSYHATLCLGCILHYRFVRSKPSLFFIFNQYAKAFNQRYFEAEISIVEWILRLDPLQIFTYIEIENSSGSNVSGELIGVNNPYMDFLLLCVCLGGGAEL